MPGPDKIFNGANDDGSGTVSVIEIAAALSKLKQRPKRSIVFMTVFGEEKGLLGSRYYGRHPIFPIEKTVADVNLEQIGRTDDSEGPQVGTCAMTGFDFSDVGEIFKAAGDLVGIKGFQAPYELRRLLWPQRQSGARRSGCARAHLERRLRISRLSQGGRPLGQSRL